MEVVDFQEMTFISGSVRFISPTTNNDYVHYYFYARLKVTVTGISDTDIKMCCSSRPLFLTLVFFEYLSPLLHLCTLHIMAWKTDAMSRTKKYLLAISSQPHPWWWSATSNQRIVMVIASQSVLQFYILHEAWEGGSNFQAHVRSEWARS